MLQFGKRLVSKGVKTTLAVTVNISKSMYGDPNSSIQVETFSDGYDEGGSSQASTIEAYLSNLKLVGSQTLANLIKKIDGIGDNQPVTCLIYDAFLAWGLDVAKQFGLHGVAFFTQTCAVNNIYYHVQRGLLPVPLSEPTVSLPGMPLLKASETPSFVYDFGSYPAFYDTVVNQFSNVDGADWVLFNTFYKLEEKVCPICKVVLFYNFDMQLLCYMNFLLFVVSLF